MGRRKAWKPHPSTYLCTMYFQVFGQLYRIGGRK